MTHPMSVSIPYMVWARLIPDLIVVFLPNFNDGPASVVRIVRFRRLVRLIRFLQLIRLWNVVQSAWTAV